VVRAGSWETKWLISLRDIFGFSMIVDSCFSTLGIVGMVLMFSTRLRRVLGSRLLIHRLDVLSDRLLDKRHRGVGPRLPEAILQGGEQLLPGPGGPGRAVDIDALHPHVFDLRDARLRQFRSFGHEDHAR